jgi:exodeoxyribonuclease VII large subunit
MDRFAANNPMIQLPELNEKLDNYKFNILKLLEIYINLKKSKLRELSAKLEALSPHAILQRGYSITRTIPDAVIVRDYETVALHQELEVLLAKGQLLCRVKGKSADGSENV